MVIMVGRVADAQVCGLVGFTLTCENSCMGYFEFVSLFACTLPFFFFLVCCNSLFGWLLHLSLSFLAEFVFLVLAASVPAIQTFLL